MEETEYKKQRKIIGDNVKKLRLEKKLTQTELAEKTGLGLSILRIIEKEKNSNPSLDTLIKLAETLGTDLKSLFQ